MTDDKLVIEQQNNAAIDVKVERERFCAWARTWFPNTEPPSASSHIFDAWLARARIEALSNTQEPALDLHTQGEAIGWERGMQEAANICGSLAETTYDDADAFEAATGCEAAIVSNLRAHQRARKGGEQ